MTANYHPVPTLAHEPPLSSSFSYPPSPFTHLLLPSLPLLLPHLSVPPFPSLETFPPILSCPIFPTSVSHERTHTVAVTDVDARVHANAYTLTRALSRQYRKLKDWAMIARGPAWPFHPLPLPFRRKPSRVPALGLLRSPPCNLPYRLGYHRQRKEKREGIRSA